MWIDEGQTPSVWRRWRGADVPTDREYEETVSGNADSPAFVAIDNTQGQLQTVAVEAGCVAKQAGTGDPSPTNIRAISERESVEIAACGTSLFDFYSIIPETATLNGITADKLPDGRIHVHGTNTNDGFTNVVHVNIPTGQRPTFPAGAYSVGSKFNVGTNLGNKLGSFYAAEQMTVSYFYIAVGPNATVDFYAIPMLVAGDVPSIAYEPYRSMGGGTVTPTEPLYGLPGAEDTVEVSVDGDVTVTRRTAVVELDGTEDWFSYGYGDEVDDSILVAYMEFADADLGYQTSINSHFENLNAAWRMNTPWTYSDNQTDHNKYFVVPKSQIADIAAWKSWLAAQKAAGTPVTIVYELAVPETEALTAISPITPKAGPVNIWTDADALTATVRGSGWETVNDTSSIQDALANLDGDLASLINEVGLLNGEVGSIAQQIISPDGIKNIVFESSEYQAMANTVEVNANELSVTQTTVTDINGRVETIEGTVRISGSNIDIGRSDSNVQLHLDNTGWSISEGGQETIYARQNRVVAPRFQTTSLIFGALAFNSSGGHFRLMKYGG